MTTDVNSYISRIRNPKKRAYAEAIREALHAGQPIPHFKKFGICLMAAQTVEINLQKFSVQTDGR